MEIQNSTANALQGIQNAQNKATEASKEIAQPNSDKVKPLVDLNQANLETQANSKVLKTTDEMVGSIIDLKA